MGVVIDGKDKVLAQSDFYDLIVISIVRQMEVCNLLQELDNFSDEDCEGEISDIETFKIGDNNESESVAAVDEDE